VRLLCSIENDVEILFGLTDELARDAAQVDAVQVSRERCRERS